MDFLIEEKVLEELFDTPLDVQRLILLFLKCGRGERNQKRWKKKY
jgi:hypothetical protein